MDFWWARLMRRVLLISSSSTLALQVQDTLRIWGMGLETVPHGAGAYQTCSIACPYEVVLVDGDTLDCNPLEFARQLRARTAPRTPCIAIVQPGRQRYAGSELLHAGYEAVLRSWNKEELFPLLQAPQRPDPLTGNAVPLRTLGPLRITHPRRPVLLAAALELGRTLTAKILERGGYSVETVSEPEQTITALETRRYAALVVNAGFPHQSGIEMVQLYRMLCGAGLETIPVLVLTADTRVAHRQACIDAGADMCLTIPFERRTLLAAMQELTRPSAKARR